MQGGGKDKSSREGGSYRKRAVGLAEDTNTIEPPSEKEQNGPAATDPCSACEGPSVPRPLLPCTLVSPSLAPLPLSAGLRPSR